MPIMGRLELTKKIRAIESKIDSKKHIKNLGVAESRYENKIFNNPKYLLFNSSAITKKYKSYPRISNAKMLILLQK